MQVRSRHGITAKRNKGARPAALADCQPRTEGGNSVKFASFCQKVTAAGTPPPENRPLLFTRRAHKDRANLRLVDLVGGAQDQAARERDVVFEGLEAIHAQLVL